MPWTPLSTCQQQRLTKGEATPCEYIQSKSCQELGAPCRITPGGGSGKSSKSGSAGKTGSCPSLCICGFWLSIICAGYRWHMVCESLSQGDPHF